MAWRRRLRRHRNGGVPKAHGDVFAETEAPAVKDNEVPKVGMASKKHEDSEKFLIHKSQCCSMTCRPSRKAP